MLGQIDILVCGNSDPGTSGLLSPFALIDGLHFNPDDEPCSFYYDIISDLSKRYEKNNIKYIKCEFDNPKDFYNAITDMQKFCDENIHVYGTSREGVYEMIINEEHDIDDTTKPSTVALAKKKKKKQEDDEPSIDDNEYENDVTDDDSNSTD